MSLDRNLDGVGGRDFIGHGRAMPSSTRSHHSQNDLGPFLWIGDQLGGDESAAFRPLLAAILGPISRPQAS